MFLRREYFYKKLLGFLSLLLLVALSGCATPSSCNNATVALPASISDDARLYQIYIGSKGELLDPYTRKTVDNEDDYLRAMFANIKLVNSQRSAGGQGPATLTVFIHGGLNSFEHATHRVGCVQGRMLADGNYPLFISWDSGFPGNYRDHLLLVRRGINRRVAGPLTSPIVLVEDLARSVIHIPVALYNVFFGQRSLHVNYESSDERAAKLSFETLEKAKDRKFQLYPSNNKYGHSAVEDTLWLNPVKLVTAPLIDGLGKGAWNSMLRRTDLVLHKSRDFYGKDKPIEEKEQEVKPEQDQKDPNKRIHVSSTAAAAFFQKWQDEYAGPHSPPAILVGHSMGTIIANNILAKYPNIDFKQIVYMGAAARLKDLETVVAPYLLAHAQTRFYNLSLHPDREVNEAHYYDMIPRGSLLVWIDDTLADINSFQDRTAGSWYNITRSANQVFTEDVRPRVYLTHFGVRDGSPQSHGDFGKCPFWREEFWTFTAYRGQHTEALECDAYFMPVTSQHAAALSAPVAKSLPRDRDTATP